MLKTLHFVAIVLGALTCYQIGMADASHSPPAASKPSPPDKAVGVRASTTLSWSASAIATSYDVYLGTSFPPPLVATTTGTNYTLGSLSSAATYYWKVVTKNAFGSTPSPTWSFSTSAKGQLTCDLNSDGVVNALDVQIAVDQVTGIVPCATADLNQDGVCTVVDLQRVINAALGQACRIGP
jgi:hypothetical protein